MVSIYIIHLYNVIYLLYIDNRYIKTYIEMITYLQNYYAYDY